MWLAHCRNLFLLFSRYMWLVPLRNSSSIACSWCLEKSIWSSPYSDPLLLFGQCMRVVACRILILLFLYRTWLVLRGILLMLLSITCVLHIAKSCFYWLNIAWRSHIAPCRILVLQFLHCMLLTLWEVLFLLFLHYIWLYWVILNSNPSLSAKTCSWVSGSS